MDSFGGNLPDDVLMEQRVDDAIRNGFALPRWGWKVPAPYNGSTGAERVLGWQKVRVAEMLGLLPPRDRCSGCGGLAAHKHCELYQRPLTSLDVCRSCHFQVHRRFTDPDRWVRFVHDRVEPQSWFRWFSLRPISSADAFRIASEPDLVSALRHYSAHRG